MNLVGIKPVVVMAASRSLFHSLIHEVSCDNVSITKRACTTELEGLKREVFFRLERGAILGSLSMWQNKCPSVLK